MENSLAKHLLYLLHSLFNMILANFKMKFHHVLVCTFFAKKLLWATRSINNTEQQKVFPDKGVILALTSIWLTLTFNYDGRKMLSQAPSPYPFPVTRNSKTKFVI